MGLMPFSTSRESGISAVASPPAFECALPREGETPDGAAGGEGQRKQSGIAGPSLRTGANESLETGHSDEIECWICRLGGSTVQNPLITNVCKCRGSVGWVHRECIDTWVLSQNRSNCPSCGAEYKILAISKVRLPQTFFGELNLLFWDFFLPLSSKALTLLVGSAINGFVVPWVIGATFYHKYLFLDQPEVSQAFNASAGTDGNSTSLHPLLEGGEHDSSFSGAWLWFSVMAYGWIWVSLWRCTKLVWGRWQAFFNDTHTVFATATEEDEDSEEAEYTPHSNTNLGTMHWMLDYCLEWTGSSPNMLVSRMVELGFLVPLSFILRYPHGQVLVTLILLLGLMLGCLVYPRRRITSPQLRFTEAQEHKEGATDLDIVLWYIAYVTEMICTAMLSIFAGVVVHFALSPYMLTFPASLSAFLVELSLTRVLAYWVTGLVCCAVSLRVDGGIIFPLFAPGVQLYFVRSMDSDLDDEEDYWIFVLSQVIDFDPFRAGVDFVRLCCVELTALYVFLAAPLYVVFAAYEAMTKDTASGPLTLPLASGFPVVMVVPGSDGVAAWLNSDPTPEMSSLVGGYSEHLFFLLAHHLTRSLRGVLAWLMNDPHWLNCVANALIVLGTGTAILCMWLFPMKRIQLKVLRGVAVFLARHVVHLEDYLFDAQRLSILDDWLHGDDQSDLPFPALQLPAVLLPRQFSLPSGSVLPKYLKLRLVLFSFLFFVTSSALFWTIPVAAMTLLLVFLPYSVPLVCISTNLIFLVFSPRTHVYVAANILLLCVIFVLGVPLQSLFFCASLWHFSRLQLVLDTLEFDHKLWRTVGAYSGEAGDGA
ncbi:putative Zn-finger protein [Trypanosoma rangeli]|uniref:Putative Zn-finger protein n=1 Tax=Trypanosoma rangeli TaxID=5698 RepID=A0A422NEB2_TRYRA|nr:putative Zn-finger protein [Trypanosoma rangeli]RNF03838.1 putative Zn-finger protein [Trypanosoma rangeli]|eukprot:RNF03838.1 putative Zn-finger protein [Trypanosoma rangeli]